MASSKSSPGPHDRRPHIVRQQCIKLTRLGKRCTRWAMRGSRLCQMHREGTMVEATMAGVARAPLGRAAKASASRFVLNEQSRDALRRLGQPDNVTDPKQALMDTVRSAWRQRQVWEAMLNAIPEEDWSHVGEVPIPGVPYTAIGARIEIIQKNLGEATKTAARSSKLAIDAGIEERLVRLAEEQAALIADTVRAGLIAGIGALHLSPAAEQAAIEMAVGQAATHLRALAAGDGMIFEGIAEEVKRVGSGPASRAK